MSDNDRPNILEVGAIRYRIAYVYDLHDAEGRAVEASLHPNHALIEVEAGLDRQEQLVTIWHEALHLVLRQAGHPKGTVSDDVLESLSYGIMNLLRHNPYLREIPKAAPRE